MDILTRILSIHNGALILPFMNYPDILVLMRCSKYMYKIYMIYPQPFSFMEYPFQNRKEFGLISSINDMIHWK